MHEGGKRRTPKELLSKEYEVYSEGWKLVRSVPQSGIKPRGHVADLSRAPQTLRVWPKRHLRSHGGSGVPEISCRSHRFFQNLTGMSFTSHVMMHAMIHRVRLSAKKNNNNIIIINSIKSLCGPLAGPLRRKIRAQQGK